MKALSVRQPYAELIVDGRKAIEYRAWVTSYRGPVLIHASNTLEGGRVLRAYYAHHRPRKLERGCIVGIVDLVNIVPGRRLNCWHLANPRRLPHVKTQGFVRLWTPSAELLRELGL